MGQMAEVLLFLSEKTGESHKRIHFRQLYFVTNLIAKYVAYLPPLSLRCAVDKLGCTSP